MSANPNRLLFVISARRSISWHEFCEAVEFLSVPRKNDDYDNYGHASLSGLLRSLEALGHCDAPYIRGASHIVVTPPALCRLPKTGLPVAVLSGARSKETKKQMDMAVSTYGGRVRLTSICDPGPLGLLPDTILVDSDSEATLEALCRDLQIAYVATPPAWTLANWFGTLSEYEATLDFRIPETLGWTRFDYNVISNEFTRIISESFPRYSRFRNPTTKLPMHVFFRGNTGAEVALDWGRLLLLKSKGISVTAYDDKRFRLCVPVKIPLPAVISRTLCLCSGKPPVLLANRSLMEGYDNKYWMMFEGVPPQIAMAVLPKIGQRPFPVQIQ